MNSYKCNECSENDGPHSADGFRRHKFGTVAKAAMAISSTIVCCTAFAVDPPATTSTSTQAAPPAMTPIEPPASASEGIEEIVVTAQRVSQSARDVPISITAFSPQQIDQLDIKSIGDLQRATPDLTFTQQFGYTRNYIRGIGSSFATVGLESPVATYVDGGYIERGFGTIFDLLDPGSIEVLKGPQGTLWGRNATGGAILVNSANPTDRDEGHVTIEGGNFGHNLAEGVANIPLTSTLSARFAAREDYDGNYIHNLYDGSGMGSHRSTQGRGKISWTPTTDFSAVLGIEYAHVNDRPSPTAERAPSPECLACAFPGSGAPVTGFFDTSNNANVPSSFLNSAENLHVNYSKGIFRFQSVTTYRKDLSNFTADLDATAIPLLQYEFQYHGRTTTQDFQISTVSSSWVNGLIAASYAHDNGRLNSSESGLAFAGLASPPPSGPGLADPSPAAQNIVLTDSTAGVVEVYLTPLERFKITLGGRYTYEDRKQNTDENTATVIANGVSPTTPIPFSQQASFNSFTPRGVLAYDFDDVNLYASYNRGFKSGGFNNPSFDYQTPVKPEHITSYEVGAKYRSPSHTLSANVAAFHYIYTDLQVAVIDIASGGQSIQNAASAKGDGVEGDMTLRVTRWLDLTAGGAYLNARFSNYPNASVATVDPTTGGLVQGTEDLSGTRLAQSPKGTLNVGANIFTEVRSWTVNSNINARYSSPYDFYPGAGGPLRNDRQPTYTLVNWNADAGPTDGHYKIGFYIDNLTDKKYYLIRDTEAPFAIFDTVARPLTFGGRLTYSW